MLCCMQCAMSQHIAEYLQGKMEVSSSSLQRCFSRVDISKAYSARPSLFSTSFLLSWTRPIASRTGGPAFERSLESLGMVRTFLPRRVPVVAMSATLTGRVRRDILSRLHFPSNFLSLDLGNNRSNVSIVVRAMHRVQSTFADLDFVIPKAVLSASNIPSTFVYIDDTRLGDLALDHLNSLLPPSLRDAGLVRPFNSTHTHEYLRTAMDHFRHGAVRVLICTDAAGMVCLIFAC